MKKHIYEVGIGIQTIYLWPEADSKEEAERLAVGQFEELSANWKGFDYDFYADYNEIHCMTAEYRKIKDDCDLLKEAEVSIACLMDEIEDITMEGLEHIQNQLTKLRSNYATYE